MPPLDPLPVWMAVACLAVLFAHAALAKLGDRALFQQHLAAYRVPEAWQAPLAWALPLAEAAVAVLLLSRARAMGAALAAVLLVVYALAMALQLRQGRRPDCGCGGDPLPLSWWLVARNGLLLPAAALAGAGTASRALQAADALLIAGTLLLATLLHAALQQLLRHRARLSLRS
ncbi:MAG: MauE/DoxX family redox-associated membrane protein [Rubrivivax sp.]